MNATNSLNIGKIGEDIAAAFLERKGFRIICRNYRKGYGEIDIIAEKGGVVRFVEVKSLSREMSFGNERESYRPEEQVHRSKLSKIQKTAEWYMAEKKDDRDFQIDVVGIYLDNKNKKATCRLYEQVL